MKAKTFFQSSIVAIALIVMCLLQGSAYQNSTNARNMRKKVLFVVTSHNQKGSTGEPTGFYLSEVAHPWHALVKAGYEVDFVSPKGGKTPVDGFNLNDPINKAFWDDNKYRFKIEHTIVPSEVNTDDYVAIHYAGGHGAMWDFADNKTLTIIAAKIYEDGGVVSAVCHGPAGLLNIKLSNGRYLVDGKKINAFTNEEEVAVKLDKVVPFLLESTLIQRGAIFEKSDPWQPHVVSDQRVVTGQNPQSAAAVGDAVVKQLEFTGEFVAITRYHVQQSFADEFRKTVNEYVRHAMANENNIMAEAFQEQEHPFIIWVIERWSNKNKLDEFSKSLPFKAIQSLSKTALAEPIKTFHLKDLEPLSKNEWRVAPAKKDDPIVIMLFVDSKAGTEENFKDIYHTAMPKFRGEPGVINYQLSQFENDKTQFVTYEKFRSEDAFQYHLKFPPIQPIIDYLNTSIKKQPFQAGLHRLIPLKTAKGN